MNVAGCRKVTAFKIFMGFVWVLAIYLTIKSVKGWLINLNIQRNPKRTCLYCAPEGTLAMGLKSIKYYKLLFRSLRSVSKISFGLY